MESIVINNNIRIRNLKQSRDLYSAICEQVKQITDNERITERIVIDVTDYTPARRAFKSWDAENIVVVDDIYDAIKSGCTTIKVRTAKKMYCY